MTASALGVGVVSLALTLSISSLMGAMDGSIHLSVVGKARATEQQIVRIVQHARAVGAQSNRLSIVMTDLTESEIRFIDGDSNPNTLADNRLQYDPKSGSAMVAAMVLTLITAGTTFAVLSYASHSLELTQRTLEYQRARAAAEAGLDYGRTQLLATLRQYQFSLSQTALQTIFDAMSPPPSMTNHVYTVPGGGGSSFRITADTAGRHRDGDVWDGGGRFRGHLPVFQRDLRRTEPGLRSERRSQGAGAGAVGAP
jgi:hypothetical protein